MYPVVVSLYLFLCFNFRILCFRISPPHILCTRSHCCRLYVHTQKLRCDPNRRARIIHRKGQHLASANDGKEHLYVYYAASSAATLVCSIFYLCWSSSPVVCTLLQYGLLAYVVPGEHLSTSTSRFIGLSLRHLELMYWYNMNQTPSIFSKCPRRVSPADNVHQPR